MSKGFLVAAQNNEKYDYVKQAYALALSIKMSQTDITSVSVMTNDEIPEQYKKVFDKIIPIPWGDSAEDKDWKVENRWKLYHVSPYEETIVLDTDMLLLEDISLWWKHCEVYDLLFCSKVKNYKGNFILKDTFHRKAFIENKLSNPYFALHYFKKSELAHNFYKILEFVTNNWEYCWTKFAPNYYQNWLSMDLATAIAIEILDCHGQVLDSGPLEFIHMKPAIQGWISRREKWVETVPYVLNNRKELIVGNMKQSKIFHYTEKEFLSDNLIKLLEGLVYNGV